MAIVTITGRAAFELFKSYVTSVKAMENLTINNTRFPPRQVNMQFEKEAVNAFKILFDTEETKRAKINSTHLPLTEIENLEIIPSINIYSWVRNHKIPFVIVYKERRFSIAAIKETLAKLKTQKNKLAAKKLKANKLKDSGKTIKQIAEEMDLAISTIRFWTHSEPALEKIKNPSLDPFKLMNQTKRKYHENIL